MPLRDHANPRPQFLATWPALMLMRLHERLPEHYRAEPRVSYPRKGGPFGVIPPAQDGPPPTLSVPTDLDEPDEFSLRVYGSGRVLVATVEFISPANNDRPESRRAFTEKVAELIRRGVSVSVVDIVGNSHFNLYDGTLGVIGHSDPVLGDEPPPRYAVTCRTFGRRPSRRLASWFHPLAAGHPLPTLPLWLHDDESIDLELELSYEDTCRMLRIG